MIKLSINPGEGVGEIKLGMIREEARALMSKLRHPLCYENDSLDYFCKNAIQLEYENNKIRFIGISDEEEIECSYCGIDVFNIEATELFKFIASKEPKKPVENPGETCFFPAQGINLWEADEQYDRKGGYKRSVYAQVGIELPKEE